MSIDANLKDLIHFSIHWNKQTQKWLVRNINYLEVVITPHFQGFYSLVLVTPQKKVNIDRLVSYAF